MTRQRTPRRTGWIVLTSGVALLADLLFLGLLLPMDPVLAASPEMPVEGLGKWARIAGKPVTFGSFQAVDIADGWYTGHTNTQQSKRSERKSERGEAVPLRKEKSKKTKRFGFRMMESSHDLGGVQCVWKQRGESEVRPYPEDRRGTGSYVSHTANELVFSCFGEPSPSGGAGWILSLTARQFDIPTGTLAFDDETLEVRGFDRLPGEKALPSSVGFFVVRQKQRVASVRLVEPVAVWIDPDSQGREREILAATAAALLLVDLPEGY